METKCGLNWKDLPSEILNAKCTDEHLFNVVAKMIVNWEYIARRLGVTESKIVEIQMNYKGNYLEQKDQFLIEWRRKYGSDATYYALMQCFDGCEMREQVEELISVITKGKTLFIRNYIHY